MILAQQFGLVPHLLDMINSGDSAGDKESVVGYGAWSFEKDDNTSELTGIELEQDNLRNFARHNKDTITKIVTKALEEAVLDNNKYTPKRDDYANVMFNKGASFVTLEKNNKLRGCIGSIFPTTSIAEDLAKNTYLAALHDSRFNPVVKEELKDITFKVSLLTGLEKFEFSSYDDLLKQIKPKTDGILIKDGKRQGVFLPAVWDDIPNKKDFLTELKIKAGLSPTYWSDDIEVFRFRAVEILQ
jgi:AmmeMemoRadiSam system protein A